MFVLKDPKQASISSLAFSPDATKLYAVAGYVLVWDLLAHTVKQLTLDEQNRHPAYDYIYDRAYTVLYLHPAGRWGFANVNSGGAIEMHTGRVVPFGFVTDGWGKVACSPDGERFASLDYRERKSAASIYCVRYWKMTDEGPECIRTQDEIEEIRPHGLAFAGSDTLVEWLTSTNYYFGYSNQPEQKRLLIRSATDGKYITTRDAPPDHLRQMIASPDGKQFLARADKRMWVYDATDWLKPPTLIEGKIKPSSMVYHPSGRYILAANNGPMINALDPTTFRVLQKWKWGVGGILRTVAVSPDGMLAAAAGPRGEIVVWDLDL